MGISELDDDFKDMRNATLAYHNDLRILWDMCKLYTSLP